MILQNESWLHRKGNRLKNDINNTITTEAMGLLEAIKLSKSLNTDNIDMLFFSTTKHNFFLVLTLKFSREEDLSNMKFD